MVTSPAKRNALVLLKAPADPLNGLAHRDDDDVVRWGHRVYVVPCADLADGERTAVAAASVTRVYSKPVTAVTHAEGGRHQIVGVSADVGSDAVFEIVCPNPAQRIVSRGVPVLADVPMCLKHCSTNALLALEVAKVANQFGMERVVACHTEAPFGKRMVLVHETSGRLTRTLPAPPLAANEFRIVAGRQAAEQGERVGKADGVLDVEPGYVNAPSLRRARCDRSGRGRGVAARFGYIGCFRILHERQSLLCRVPPAADRLHLLAELGTRVRATVQDVGGLHGRLLALDFDGSGAVLAGEVQLACKQAGCPLSDAELDALARCHPARPQQGARPVINVRDAMAAQVL